ncbi:MAG: hypothetical protein ACREA9_20580 [Pyrinomonadaceae bacterium]
MKLLPVLEGRRQKVAPFSVYAQRVAAAVGAACGVIAFVLLIGISGYHWLAGLDWVDSLLEASMILGGMGPVNPIKTNGAKIFASGYALFSGLVFIGIMGIVLTPVVHRALHKFHVE